MFFDYIYHQSLRENLVMVKTISDQIYTEKISATALVLVMITSRNNCIVFRVSGAPPRTPIMK